MNKSNFNKLMLLSKKGVKLPEQILLQEAIIDEIFSHLRTSIEKKLEEIDNDNIKSSLTVDQEIKRLIIEHQIDPHSRKKVFQLILSKIGRSYKKDFLVLRPIITNNSSFDENMKPVTYIRGENQILWGIKECEAQIFSGQILRNRQSFKLKLNIVISKMVAPDVSGLLYTGNPYKDNPDEYVIISNYGHLEELNEDQTDKWVLNQNQDIILEKIGHKEKQFIFNKKKGQGTERVDVPPKWQKRASLKKNQLKALIKTGYEIEKSFSNTPQEIEWTYSHGHLYILYSRPMSIYLKIDKSYKKIVFLIEKTENEFITPLHFSLLAKLYEYSLIHFFTFLRADINSKRRSFKNLFGHFDGKVFKNLNNWHEIISIWPGCDFNKGLVCKTLDLKISAKPKRRTLAKFLFFFITLCRIHLKFFSKKHDRYKLSGPINDEIVYNFLNGIQDDFFLYWSNYWVNNSLLTIYQGLYNKQQSSKNKFFLSFLTKKREKHQNQLDLLKKDQVQFFENFNKHVQELAYLWMAKGLIKNEEDLDYLTLDEISAFMEGNTLAFNLKTLIKLRKDEKKDHFKAHTDSFYHYGPIHSFESISGRNQ